MVLTREGKVFAAAAADAAKTDYKHEVTPDRGNLMRVAARLGSNTFYQIQI